MAGSVVDVLVTIDEVDEDVEVGILPVKTTDTVLDR